MLRTSWRGLAATAAASSCLLLGFLVPVSAAPDAGVMEQRILKAAIPAGGQAQWIECSGPGAGVNTAPTRTALVPTKIKKRPKPTIVLISGLGVGHSYWGGVHAQLVANHRVCWYDRSGLGWSAPRSGPTTVGSVKQAKELRALLDTVGEKGPLVVVGHSYGGLLARTFANRYAASTVGLALIDPSNSTQWQDGGRYWGEANTLIDMKKVQKAAAGLPVMGSKPLAVVGAGRDNSLYWHVKMSEMKHLGTNSIQVTARNSYHEVMSYQPSVVTEAINEVWNSAVTGAPIAKCRTNRTLWSSLDAYCGRKKANSQ